MERGHRIACWAHRDRGRRSDIRQRRPRARAAAIARIAGSSWDYLAGLLDHRPDIQVLVLSEADWAEKCEVELFGLPNANEGTLTVAGTAAGWW